MFVLCHTAPERDERMNKFTVAYGSGIAHFTLPAGWSAQPATPPGVAAAGRRGRLSSLAALAAPVGSPRLRDLARPGQRACIVFTDATRACPDDVLVPLLLDELAAGGIAPDDDAAGATGAHRASTPAEKAAKLGPRSPRVIALDHDASDPALLASPATRTACRCG
jgi:hypothetical protein